jgi:hypothetical protein
MAAHGFAAADLADRWWRWHGRARRFTASIAERPADRPVVLPRRLARLASAVAGGVPVEVRVGPASAASLGAAGRPAATVGRVVHLADVPRDTPEGAAIVAHEVVHAAAAAARPPAVSAQPRFFDDDRSDSEERLARAVGRLAERLVAEDADPLVLADVLRTVPPGGGGSTLRRAGPADLEQLTGAAGAPRLPWAPAPDRAGAESSGRPGGSRPGGVQDRAPEPGLAGLLAEFSRRRSSEPSRGGAGSGPSVAGGRGAGRVDPAVAGGARGSSTRAERLPAGRHGPQLGPLSPAGPLLRRLAGGRLPSRAGRQEPMEQVPGAEPAPVTVDQSTGPATGELIDWIVEQVEQRVLRDLERRGLRHRPEVW